MSYILRTFGTGTPHILGYFAGGVPKIGGVEYPMTPDPKSMVKQGLAFLLVVHSSQS